ncbi:hypothetical protein DL771_002012 [Monosporascus sp. 5C6A]|nr:hypothetical protein DL771_002012 [Monosporascus sp. 5C6A]
MSLHRVGSLETLLSVPPEGQRSRRGSVSSVATSIQARKLTFNPLPESWNPAIPENVDHPGQPVGAFEVAQWKRILQVCVTVFYCLFAAGVVFGYAALKPVLKDEGAYHDVCDGEYTCTEIHLNLMFTVAAVATNVAALPIGAILDHFGPRVCGIFGATFLTVGALLMSFAQEMPFDGFLVGYLFLALGGPFTYISSFHLSNAFPRRSGLILALLTGAFDSSSALFLVYRIIYEKTGGSFGHHRFFLAYLVVPATILIFQFTILPKHSYKTVGELMETIEDASPSGSSQSSCAGGDQIDEQTALLREEQREHRENVAHEIEDLLGVGEVDKQTVVQMTRINYFVATIRPQYEALFGSESQAVQINNFFDVALPVGGILSIPFIGVILDHTSTVAVLATLVTVATTIGVLGVLPYMWAAYANVCLFVLYRPFYYTAVSDYSAKVFGFETFGTVYGTIICLSGLLNFSQSGLDYLFHETFRGDPVPVNVILLSIGLVIGIALVAYVGVKGRQLKKKGGAGYSNAVAEY